MAFGVNERAREIGIRMALGARPGEVARLVVRRVAVAVGAGVCAGLVASAAAAHVVERFLVDVTVRDRVAFAGAIVVLVAAAVAAAWSPVRRAARLDPMMTIRSE